MTDLTHDTFANLESGTPVLFTAAGFALPLGLGAQFLLAGQALFGGNSWDLHIATGAMVAVPVFLLLGHAIFVRRLRGFAWWAGAVAVLYLVQIALAAGGPGSLVFHPLNAALLLVASIVLLFKVERRRGVARGLA